LKALLPVVAYVLFFGALVAVSRNNHPTLTLNLVASGIMTLASLLVFVLPVRVTASGAIRVLLVGCACLVAGAVAAVSISLVYDALWGPDPLRFGMIENVGMDTAVVLAGWLWASLVARLVR